MADPTIPSDSSSNNDSNSSSRRRSLGFDELIAILVAFGSIGGILWWGLTRTDGNFNWLGELTAPSGNAGNVASAPPLFNLGTTSGTATAPAGSIAGTAQPGTVSGATTAPIATVPGTTPNATAQPGSNWFGAAAGGALIGSAVTSGSAPAGGVPFSSNAISPTVSPAASPAAAPAAPPPQLAVPEPTVAASFSDVTDDYWASPFINALSQRGIIQGFQDGTFQPDRPVSRGEYAALIKSIFEDTSQPTIAFKDVPAGFWAAQAIDTAVKANFLKGYPENVFEPEKPISRMEVLLSLTNGFNLKQKAAAPIDAVNVYQDNTQIPAWAKPAIAAATKSGVVVNYPTLDVLNPNQPATRAEVTALIHQALVSAGKVPAIDSPYVVKP